MMVYQKTERLGLNKHFGTHKYRAIVKLLCCQIITLKTNETCHACSFLFSKRILAVSVSKKKRKKKNVPR
jgi:hypothetical protein